MMSLGFFERLENYFLSISYSKKARYVIFACNAVAVIMFFLFLRVQIPIATSLENQKLGITALQNHFSWIEKVVFFVLEKENLEQNLENELNIESMIEKSQKSLGKILDLTGNNFLYSEIQLHQKALVEHWNELKRKKIEKNPDLKRVFLYFLEMSETLAGDISVASDLYLNIDNSSHRLIKAWTQNLFPSIKNLALTILEKEEKGAFDKKKIKAATNHIINFYNNEKTAYQENEVLSSLQISRTLQNESQSLLKGTKDKFTVSKAIERLKKQFALSDLTKQTLSEIFKIQIHSLFIQRAIGWGCIIFGVGTVLMLYMTKVIRYPLIALRKGVSDLASGDLSVRLEIVSCDEVGEMSQAFNSMASLFEEILIHANQITSDLANASSHLFTTAKELEENVIQQDAVIQTISIHAKEISDSVHDFSESLKEVRKTAATTSQLASTGKASLSDMETSLKTMIQASEEMVMTLSELKEKLSTISHVIQAIVEIADESNLLSLNTAIKAGKTGEKGLGFAVVASKIRELANQIASLTLEVEAIVKGIVEAVSDAVLEVDHFCSQIRNQVEDATSIGEQLKNLINHAQDLIQAFEKISEGMHAQTFGVAEIHEGLLLQQESSKKTTRSISKLYREIEYLYHATSNLVSLTKKFTFSKENKTDPSKKESLFPNSEVIGDAVLPKGS